MIQILFFYFFFTYWNWDESNSEMKARKNENLDDKWIEKKPNEKQMISYGFRKKVGLRFNIINSFSIFSTAIKREFLLFFVSLSLSHHILCTYLNSYRRIMPNSNENCFFIQDLSSFYRCLFVYASLSCKISNQKKKKKI